MSSQSSETTSFSRWFCSLGSALGGDRERVRTPPKGEDTPRVRGTWGRGWGRGHSLRVQDGEVLLGQLVVLQLAHLGLLGHGEREGFSGVVEVISSWNEGGDQQAAPPGNTRTPGCPPASPRLSRRALASKCWSKFRLGTSFNLILE